MNVYAHVARVAFSRRTEYVIAAVTLANGVAAAADPTSTRTAALVVSLVAVALYAAAYRRAVARPPAPSVAARARLMRHAMRVLEKADVQLPPDVWDGLADALEAHAFALRGQGWYGLASIAWDLSQRSRDNASIGR